MRRRLPAIAALLLLAFAIVSAGSAGVAAPDDVSSRADYAARVGRALEAVEESSETLLDSREGSDLAATVNTLVPASEYVAIGDHVVATDNSTLRSLVTELDSADDESARRYTSRGSIASPESLDVVAATAIAEVPQDPELLEELIAEQGVDPSAIQEFLIALLERINAWFESLFGGIGESSAATTVLVWVFRVLIAALVVFLAYIVFRVLQRWRRSVTERDTRIAEEAAIPIVAAAEGLPDDVLGHADKLAEEGAYREAVRALYGGAARTLVEAGAVRQSRTLTAAELIAVVSPVVPKTHTSLVGLSSSFEVSWYGHRDPGHDGYDRARADHLAVTAEAERHAEGGDLG